jgi:isopenicillin N synthase-like dioxygenase
MNGSDLRRRKISNGMKHLARRNERGEAQPKHGSRRGPDEILSESVIVAYPYIIPRPRQNDFLTYRILRYKHYPDCETLEIAREEILRASPSAIPSSMRTHAEMLQYFITASHDITLILLNHLSKALNMPSLLTAHSDKHNDCALKFESVPMEARLEDVPFSEHTDMGTFTLLFCPEYTTELPVRSSSSSTAAEKAWEFIEPRAGCAIVNVADSLQRLTDGELVSSLHRVGQPLASAKERFCLLYYLRPDAQ